MTLSPNEASIASLISLKFPKVKVINPNDRPQRGLAASETISSLEQVMNIRPLLKVYNDREFQGNDSNFRKLCDYCSVFSGKYLIICSCGYVGCCGLKCMKIMNKFHQHECLILKAITEIRGHDKPIPEFVRLVIRVFCFCVYSESLTKRLCSELTTHEEKFTGGVYGEFINNNIDYIVDSVHILAEEHCETERLMSKDQLTHFVRRIFCVCIVNANMIMNEKFEKIGICIDYNFSLINHSCVPNTTTIPFRNYFSVVSTTKIPANKQITTTYCYSNQPRFLRQHELTSKFFFKCRCSLCRMKHDIFFSFNCPQCDELFGSLNLDSIQLNKVIIELKNQISDEKCVGCSRAVNMTQLKRIYLLFKTLMWFLLLSVTESYVEELKLDTVDVFVELIRDLGMTIGLDKINPNDLMERYGSGPMSHQLSNFVLQPLKQIVDEVLNSRIVPEYVYPVNIYLTNFVDYFDQYLDSNLTQLDLMLLHLKETLRVSISIEIASDLSEAKLSKYYKFAAIAGELVEVFKEMIRCTNKETTVWSLIEFDALLTIIGKSAVFFSLQALEFIVTTTSFDFGMRITPEWYIESIQYFANTFTLASDWDLKNAKDFTNRRFLKEVKHLLNFANIRYYSKSNDIRIQFCNRTRGSLFQAVETLTCKDNKCLQARVYSREDHQNFRDFCRS